MGLVFALSLRLVLVHVFESCAGLSSTDGGMNMMHETLRQMNMFLSFGFCTSLCQIIRILLMFFYHFYNSMFKQLQAWDRLILLKSWLRLGRVGRTHHHAAPSNGHHFHRVSAHNCVAGTKKVGCFHDHTLFFSTKYRYRGCSMENPKWIKVVSWVL